MADHVLAVAAITATAITAYAAGYRHGRKG